MKRLTALILAVSLIFSGFSLTGNVSDFRRTAEGCFEVVVRTLRSTFGIRNYPDYDELCDIPETENGYVPQGYCFSESKNLHFISYYHSEKASIIAVIDNENNTVKTLNLKKANGKDFTGHAGGIAEDGCNFYIVEGKKIYRLYLNELVGAENGADITLREYITTDVKCSYLNCDGEFLYAGEFYTFTTDGSYDTDNSHHMAISLFETTYARCNAYRISDVVQAFANESEEVLVPSMIFTTPNCVQGFARMPDGSFALSISYGRNNNSSFRFYENVTENDSDFSVAYGEKSVPAYHLGNKAETRSLRMPPLLEGIDDMNGEVSGIFESCAQKYSDAAVIVEKICIFS